MMEGVTLETIERNKKLAERYPFLKPSAWILPNYNYEFTFLDHLPQGWRKAFGEEMCEEILSSLDEEDAVDDFQILEIKEKYGMMRIAYAGGTAKIHNEIIPKYEKLSQQRCFVCGREIKQLYMLGSWLVPLCMDCGKQHFM